LTGYGKHFYNSNLDKKDTISIVIVNYTTYLIKGSILHKLFLKEFDTVSNFLKDDELET
jgi:hypothetical protein